MPEQREKALRDAIAERIVIIDGATGTYLQDLDLSAADFGGEELDGCNEHLVMSRPDVVSAMHCAYLEAGADIIETNSFGSTPVVLAEYGLAHEARMLNREAAVIARRVADAASTPDKPRFVAGSMGPTTKTISGTGGITFEEPAAAHHPQAPGPHPHALPIE